MAMSSTSTTETPDSTVRLLVPSSSSTPAEEAAIELLGRRWVVNEFSNLSSRIGAEGYACVSYAWGAGRAEHPFDASDSMSDRTMAVVETAIRIEPADALWVDAFCVPREEQARTACLRMMGAIYEHAAKVVVVLSERCSSLVSQVASSGPVDTDSMLAFERDAWLTRVWTYQELVNCNNVRFIAEGGGDVSVGAEDVLNHVGSAMSDYRKAEGYDSFEMNSQLPNLNSLEDLILDWKISMPPERSAYRVMCGMEGRHAAQPEDYFYAMIGALAPSPGHASADPAPHPAEYFMQVCEARGDYSFIYSTGPRAEVPGRRWRPAAADRFEPVFPWSSYGDGQSGTLYPTHIQLDGMWCAALGNMAPAADQFLTRWLNKEGTDSPAQPTPARILRRLRDAGFSGCGQHLEMESGFFFPHSPLLRSGEILVAVATGVRMPQGAPGLVLRQGRSAVLDYCGVGVFVGQVPKSGEPISIG